MVCVVYSWEVVPGKAWNETAEILKKMHQYSKETFGQESLFMVSRTGKHNRAVISEVYESMGAHEEYMKKVEADAGFKEVMKGMDFPSFLVQGSFATEYYDVLE
jgi:quinol monooxygenase YgiN